MDDKELTRKNLRLSIMFGSFAFGIMSFLLPIYSKRIGASALAIGGIFSAFSIVTLIMRPIIGKLIDLYGRKLFFVLAFLLYSVSMLLYSYSTSIMLLYISRIVQALGSSFMWITAYTIAIDASEEGKRGVAIGRVDGAHAQGSLYGALIGFGVLLYLPLTLMEGWNVLFKIYSVLSIVAGFIAVRSIPETKYLAKIENEKNEKNVLNCEFIKLMIVVFIGAISTSMLSPLLMVYLQDRFTTNIGMLGLAFIPAALVYAFLPVRFGGVSDKMGRKNPMVIGLIGSGIASLSFVFISNIELLIAFWVIESVGIVLASPAQEAYVSEIVGESTRGYGYGLYLFVGSLGSAIGPLVGGWLYDAVGHAIPFYLNGIILIINAALVYVLFKENKKQTISA